MIKIKKFIPILIALLLCVCMVFAACNLFDSEGNETGDSTEQIGDNTSNENGDGVDDDITGDTDDTKKEPDDTQNGDGTDDDIQVGDGQQTPETPDVVAPTPEARQTIYLWDDNNIPAWRGRLNSSEADNYRPYMESYPARGEIKGAVLICPGGAFQFRSMYPEGYMVADRLSALGYQCFVVSYRLSPYSQAESALDLQRAIRYVRYFAEDYGINTDDIAVVGFSAGGILCGEVVLNFKGTTSPTTLDSSYIPDAVDLVSSDVAACGHIYSFYGRLSVSNNNVETLKRAIPSFYAYGTQDPFYSQFNQNVAAVQQAGIPVESHVYQGQPHGFGAGNANSNWIPDFDTWLKNIFENN